MVGWGGSYVLSSGPVSLKADVRPESRVVVFKLGGKGKLPPPQQAPRDVPEPPALTAGEDQIAAGRHLYQLNCSNCHGPTAISGGVLPDLRYLTAEKHLQFKGILSGARVNRGMPSFAKVLSSEEMEHVHQFLIKRAHDLRADLAAMARK